LSFCGSFSQPSTGRREGGVRRRKKKFRVGCDLHSRKKKGGGKSKRGQISFRIYFLRFLAMALEGAKGGRKKKEGEKKMEETKETRDLGRKKKEEASPIISPISEISNHFGEGEKEGRGRGSTVSMKIGLEKKRGKLAISEPSFKTPDSLRSRGEGGKKSHS